MPSLRYAAIRAALEVLALPPIARVARRFSSSKGVIFTLHRVLPQRPALFSPNAILQIHPEFLAAAIHRVRALGLDIVDLDEAVRRIEEPAATRKFVVFTLDDGYRDNLEHALPIFRQLDCPFTLYLPTALVDGVGEVWWQALEDIIAGQARIVVAAERGEGTFDTSTPAHKQHAYDVLYARMRAMPEHERVAQIRQLAQDYGFDLERHCRSLIMDWSALANFARDPLCTIGAHTVHHYELRKLPLEQARNEMAQSLEVLEAQFGTRPRHFSYPIGGTASAGPREFELARELGLRTAVTTRPGGLYHRHKDALFSLPRVSLNGSFQARRFIDVLATGALLSAPKTRA